jgi:hypothetical protein
MDIYFTLAAIPCLFVLFSYVAMRSLTKGVEAGISRRENEIIQSALANETKLYKKEPSKMITEEYKEQLREIYSTLQCPGNIIHFLLGVIEQTTKEAEGWKENAEFTLNSLREQEYEVERLGRELAEIKSGAPKG